MTGATEVRLKLNPVSRSLSMKFGNIAMYENVFILQPATASEANVAHIEYTRLLPPKESSTFINVSAAYRLTNIKPRTLRRLSKQGKLRAVKSKTGWLIDEDSLMAYMQNAEAL